MLNFKVNNLKILGLLNKLINFALLRLAEFDQFDSFSGGVGGGGEAKLRLGTNSVQLGLSLAKLEAQVLIFKFEVSS